MSNLAQITQQAARDDIPAPTVERDYVLAHIIAALGTIDDSHCLVFKGGTAPPCHTRYPQQWYDRFLTFVDTNV